jgi:hypothetical protein
LAPGSAVCAKGFTCETEVAAGAYWIDGEGEVARAEPGPEAEPGGAGNMPVDPAGERGSPAGVPHAVQNFRLPMSSAPHFAQ